MNLSSWIVLFIVVAIIGLVISVMVRDKKAGKSPCGCDCGSCDKACHCAKNIK